MQNRLIAQIVLSIAVAYGLLVAKYNTVISLYTMLNDEVVGLTFIVFAMVWFAITAILIQYVDRRKTLKAIWSQRKHGRLLSLVQAGLSEGGCFAYLAKEVPYANGKLPPMTIVYVIGTDGEQGWLQVIPKFDQQIDMGETMDENPINAYKQRAPKPSLVVRVQATDLYKHIPPNLIPEIIY